MFAVGLQDSLIFYIYAILDYNTCEFGEFDFIYEQKNLYLKFPNLSLMASLICWVLGNQSSPQSYWSSKKLMEQKLWI